MTLPIARECVDYLIRVAAKYIDMACLSEVFNRIGTSRSIASLTTLNSYQMYIHTKKVRGSVRLP